MRCATYKSSWGSVNSGNLSSSRRISLINAVNSWSTSIIKPLFELVPGIDGVKPWCALWALNKPEINPTLLTYNCMNDDNLWDYHSLFELAKPFEKFSYRNRYCSNSFQTISWSRYHGQESYQERSFVSRRHAERAIYHVFQRIASISFEWKWRNQCQK